MGDTNPHGLDATPPPLALSRLTFPEIEQEIERLPILLLPLGGCEPYGSFGSAGIATAVVQSLAWELSRRCRLLCAPAFSFGNSTPFKSFGGSAGIKPRTLTNALGETIRMWFFQGIRTVVILDALYDNAEAVDLTRERLMQSHPGCRVEFFSLQHDERVKAFVTRQMPGAELYRAEYGMLSMASWIDSGLVRKGLETGGRPGTIDPRRVRTWRKRGSDPEQLRKFAPNGSCSEIAAFYRADFGEALFQYILGLLEESVTRTIRDLKQ